MSMLLQVDAYTDIFQAPAFSKSKHYAWDPGQQHLLQIPNSRLLPSPTECSVDADAQEIEKHGTEA